MSTESRSRTVAWFGHALAKPALVIGGALVLLVAGAVTFAGLRRDLFPDLALPSVQILLQSPGRSAVELELAVAQPAEQALQGLPDVRRIATTLQPGVVQIVVAFENGVDPFRSRVLVGERLASVSGAFPKGTSAPILTSAAGRLLEIQELVLEGPAIDPMVLRDVAVRTVVPRLQAVPGVARVELLGGGDRQLQVTLSPESLRTAGASLDQVLAALDGSEREAGAGVLESSDRLAFVTVGTLASSPEAVRRLPVHTAHGLVPLGDLAEVREAPGFRLGLARFQGYEAVSLRVVKQPAADTLSTAGAIKKVLPSLQHALPEGITLRLFYDQAQFVEQSLSGVGMALAIGGLFVALVLVILLGHLRAALIVLILLPLATLGAALPLAGLGLGLNAMTLGGLAIAVGLLVDAGIILVENLAHRLRGAARSERRIVIARAAAEVTTPVATAVAVILAVFVPLVAVGGIAGALYAPLAIAVASAMAIALALSLTLVPVLVDRFLPEGSSLDEPAIVGRIKVRYRPLLEAALAHRWTTILLATALAVPAMVLAWRLPTEFLPALDEGAVLVQTFLPSDASVAAVDEANRQLETALSRLPGVTAQYRRTGRGEVTEDPMPHYSSDILVLLAPGTPPKGVLAEIEELDEQLPYPVEITTPMGMRIAEGIGGTPADIQLELFHPDLDALAAREPELRARLSRLAGVESVTADTAEPLPGWRVALDDDALRRLDVPRGAVLATVQAALQGIAIEPRFEGVQRIERIVRFPNDGRLSAESLKRLPLVVEEGRIVDLGQVARIEESPTPSMIRRKNGQRRLGLNIRTSGDLGGTARRIDQALNTAPLPQGTTRAFSGKVEEARETQRRLTIASGAALMLVMGLLYGALGRAREVAVVLATLPVAFAGGLYALVLAGESWNASSIVGLIGLFGVAVQNSLVLISQTKELVAGGAPFAEALRDASVGRVRPKLMTAGAAILGLAPMLLGFGGSELERPLAVVMIGGLVTSTLFTLLVLPTVYAWAGSRTSAPATLP